MPPRRMSQHLQPDEGPPQESTNDPFQQPSTQILPTITKGHEQPTFRDILEVHLHQPAHISTQTSRGAPRQSPPRAPSSAQMAQGDAELDHIQAHDLDEEANEDKVVAKEELVRVQQEIERLR
jgi:hypothetical protein